MRSADIASWVERNSSSPPTPPPDELIPLSLKRKHRMSFPPRAPSSSHRTSSPKRPRQDEEDVVQPHQSASQAGSRLELNESNIFNPPPSRVSSRSLSPTREMKYVLSSAQPPVLIESLNGLEHDPPKPVEQLGDQLAEGIDSGFIPQGLRVNDPDIGRQFIKPVDFDNNDLRSADELSTLWKEVKEIFLNARDCQDGNRDENAWCDEVVRPLVQLAIFSHGNGKWRFQSIQSQSINPLYLPTILAPTHTGSSLRKVVARQADYTLSYSHRDRGIADLYRQLNLANRREVGHTLDAFTKRHALFSAFEVKPALGGHIEAETQVAIFLGASIHKKEELAKSTHTTYEPSEMVEPGLTIVGHEHSVYYAYPRGEVASRRSSIHVLGPDQNRFERLSTYSLRGVFRLLRFYGNLLRYGMDENGYWGQFFRPILENLASQQFF